MGQMMRRYWVPACLSEEVAERDCAPHRTQIFGDRLVVFRDSDGKLGVVDERCPHRLASLALGRNEDDVVEVAVMAGYGYQPVSLR